ncbi:MAG: cysteine hydrolase [Verrucomicrobia bacterium]|nr:cysteine hydrolase [Verrucomicrobiota bacterium]
MNHSVVVVLDLINDIVSPQGKFTATAEFVKKHGVIEAANQVIALARSQQLPILLVKVGFSANYLECPLNSPLFGKAKELQALKLNTWGTEFHENLAVQPSDPVIIKHRVSAFYATDLEPYLRANQVQHLILLGVSTEMAVQTTAREAHDRDYLVTVVADACGSSSMETHQSALKELGRIATITTANDPRL